MKTQKTFNRGSANHRGKNRRRFFVNGCKLVNCQRCHLWARSAEVFGHSRAGAFTRQLSARAHPVTAQYEVYRSIACYIFARSFQHSDEWTHRKHRLLCRKSKFFFFRILYRFLLLVNFLVTKLFWITKLENLNLA